MAEKERTMSLAGRQKLSTILASNWRNPEFRKKMKRGIVRFDKDKGEYYVKP